MGVLDEIVAHRRQEVSNQKELYPRKLLEKSHYFAAPPVSLRKYLTRPDKVGIIAEIKRRSPSRGVLNQYISIEQLSIGYMQAGASALSILTEKKYFGGSSEDLTTARKFNFCPILRKDFIVDEYQVIEAKSIGADAILLIARILKPEEAHHLGKLAQSLGMEVLLEVHNKLEIETYASEAVNVIGVNNRDLDTLQTDIKVSFELAAHIPKNFVKISESGISEAETIKKLKTAGYAGFLIGESFMRHPKPEGACKRLVDAVTA